MYVDDAGGDEIGESMKGLLAAARIGGFAVNEKGGKALLKACRNLRDWIDNEQHRFARLALEPPLGSSLGANVMKPYVSAVATDDQGFLTRLMALRESLVDAEEAIETAMANYADTDAQNATNLSTK